MSLDMHGHIDDVFRSVQAIRIPRTGSYVDGIFTHTDGVGTPHTANLQPVTQREIDSLKIGGRRISDYRKLYINDGIMAEIAEADDWEFDANGRGVERYETASLDNRHWRNYCKVVVVLRDA